MKETTIKHKIRTYTEQEIKDILKIPLNEELISLNEVIDPEDEETFKTIIEVKTRIK